MSVGRGAAAKTGPTSPGVAEKTTLCGLKEESTLGPGWPSVALG